MAEGAQKELREEASCSVCLAFFRDPVMIPECGHTFCRACLTHSGGTLEGEEASCPLCRGPAQEGTLQPNQQLANIEEITHQLSTSEGSTEERGGQKRKRGVCELHQEPLKLFCREDEAPLCLVCSRSQEHKGHLEISLEEASQENTVFVSGRKGGVCQKHQEPLKLFCKDHRALVCWVCVHSRQHRDHKICPLEEPSQDYKKRVTGQKQEMVAKFRELHSFLEEQENRLLAQMEEVEKVVARNRDQEMEEKFQPPAGGFLHRARIILERYQEKRQLENPACSPLAMMWQIWDLSSLNPVLEGIMKKVKDTVDSGLHPRKANVTLDPDTAHPQLILSEDQKSVRQGEEAQTLRQNPERFDSCCAVLGREGFTGGRHFWEVLVGSKGEWAFGVARKSVKRKGEFFFTPKDGIWAVGKWDGCRRAAGHIPLGIRLKCKRIRICLNYDIGEVAFLDADQVALIYEFSGASFSGETLLPFFWVSGKGHLKLPS